MKGRTLSILGIFAAAIGAILIVCYNAISVAGVTITGGILFVGVGLVNLLFFSSISKNENASGRVLSLITNAAAIILGLCMLVFRTTFSPLISFIFGLFIAVCALWQFFVLAVGTRPYQLPVWLYLFPVLLAGGSVYIFVFVHNKADMDSMLMLSTGISLAVMGGACMIEGSVLGIVRRNNAHGQQTQQAAPVDDMHSPQVSPTPTQPVHTPSAYSPSGYTPTVNTPSAATDMTGSYNPGGTLVPTKRTTETTDDLDDVVN